MQLNRRLSLKNTVENINDPVKKAQITVFYIVFMLNFVKIGAVLPHFIVTHDVTNIVLCCVGLVFTAVVLFLLLTRPQYLQILIHSAIICATIPLWAEVFLAGKSLNLMMVQEVFMICMWSFYGLKGWWGLIYSCLSALPLLVPVFLSGSSELEVKLTDGTMHDSLIVLVINFLIIFLGHFYYRNTLYKAIKRHERLNDELEKSNKANSLFFSTMSHELRTPLNAVIGMSNLLIDSSKDEEEKENLDILKFSGESLLSLINDILDFNKMASGRVELEFIPFGLKDLIENACAGLRIKATEKGLFCRTKFDPEIENIKVMGDPTRLLQVMYNLIGNAIKFTKKGGVEVNVSVLQKKGDKMLLAFAVKDTGMGITVEQQKYIFDPYTQASSNTTRKYGGTGLGLSIVTRLLSMHNSKIQLKSEPNIGSEFYFEIYYQVAKQELSLQPLKAVDNSLVNLSDLKILMAEDNVMNILFMKKLFNRWGISMDIAENGEEAVKMLEVKDYDLILMDIQMPVMNGYEATICIRKMADKVKAGTYIIALSASVSEDLHSNVIAVGMNDSLTKPFQQNDLYEKLKNVPLVNADRIRNESVSSN